MKRLFYFLMIIIFGCVKEPSLIDNNNHQEIDTGIYILCEGLWKYNNASLDFLNIKNNLIYNNVFYQSNSLGLGDLANDIAIKGDSLIILVSTQNNIIIVDKKTFKLISKFNIPGDRLIRNFDFYKDTNLIITDLYNNSILIFSLIAGKIKDEIEVGAAPEGIVVNNDFCYVVNSGYGDYLNSHPKASTISVVDLKQKKEIKLINTGKNPIEIIKYSEQNSLFVSYRNLPSLKDTFGGIIEYQLPNLVEINHWKLNNLSLNLNINQSKLYFISDYGLSTIDFKTKKIINCIENPNKNEHWHSIGIAEDKFIIGNAKNYQINGEIIIFNNNFQKISSYQTGVNPSKIVY